MTQLNQRYLYYLSFLEGGAVMACELVGAKMLAPYFGTSLYVWAAALGLTLGGLMSGYFWGGIISKKRPNQPEVLYVIMMMAACFLCLMPLSSAWIMPLVIQLPLQWGALLSLLVFMFPPLVFMGMVSPMIIHLLTQKAEAAGNRAGNVYAISTLGGIIATFLMGFEFIPAYGISWPIILTGFLLGLFPLISLIKRQKILGFALLSLLLLLGLLSRPKDEVLQGQKTIFHSEGIMGQLKVIDLPLSDGNRMGRGLVVNNTLQTVIDPKDPTFTYWPYTDYVPYMASVYPAGKQALLLGLGGGTLFRRLEALGFELEAVEIDQRIRDLSIEYFQVNPEANIIVDDARHYIRVAPHLYDLIVYDVFKGESAPEHVITVQSMQETRALLKPQALLMLNFYGYIKGELGRLSRSVIKTLKYSGWNCELYATPGQADHRNIIVAAWPDTASNPLEWLETYNSRHKVDLQIRPIPMPDLEDAIILRDEKPQPQLFAKAAMQWRRLYNNYFIHLNEPAK